tara:strand:+ start:1167 stop:1409 length:243 start_codon:yes stop_codon:yes gene_type:complete
MIEPSIWLSENEASEILKVDEQFLQELIEWGYLKPGSHWRSSNDPEQLPWKPKFFYYISGCKEVIGHLQINETYLDHKAA